MKEHFFVFVVVYRCDRYCVFEALSKPNNEAIRLRDTQVKCAVTGPSKFKPSLAIIAVNKYN